MAEDHRSAGAVPNRCPSSFIKPPLLLQLVASARPFLFYRLLGAVLVVLTASDVAAADTLNVGSKRFTESYVLGEIIREAAERAGTAARHKSGLGNTGILYAALSAGAIDVYPEYTGTIARELLKLEGNPPIAVLNQRLAPMGLGIAAP